MSNKIFNLVSQAILAQTGSDVQIFNDLRLKEDLGLPSIKLVMLLTNLTQKLQISIMDFSDHELLRVKTVKDLTDLLTIKMANPV